MNLTETRMQELIKRRDDVPHQIHEFWFHVILTLSELQTISLVHHIYPQEGTEGSLVHQEGRCYEHNILVLIQLTHLYEWLSDLRTPSINRHIHNLMI